MTCTMCLLQASYKTQQFLVLKTSLPDKTVDAMYAYYSHFYADRNSSVIT